VLIATVLLWPSPHEPGEGLFDLPVPTETVAIVEALESSPPATRPLVIKALNNTVTSVRLEPGFPPLSPDLRRARELEWMFSHYSRVLAGRPFRVEQRPGLLPRLMSPARRRPPGPSVRILVALRGGGVLVIEHRPPLILRSYLARGAAVTAATALALLAGLAIAMRQAARPVEALARAAHRFSIDQGAPPLPIGGPRELRELSRAFNDMQGRIRGLVEDRTRALAAIAHDLRTYLTRLRLRADFIEDIDQRQRAVRDIEEMSLLLEDTLTFARPAAGGPRDRSICEIGREVETFVSQRQELGEPVRRVGDTARASAWVACSRLSLQRMLHNLAENALRYGGGAEITHEAVAGVVEIEVRDRGPGIPAETLTRVTEPFERLESSRGRDTGGAGLGLAIVKSLAEQAGGTLILKNAADGGLRATLRLPTQAPSSVTMGERL
jgi:signal transduction histidine kinase